MNNKMAKNTYISRIESKKHYANKKNIDRIMDMERILMAVRWERGVGEWVKR